MQNRNLERFLGNGNASEEFVLLIEDKNKSYKYEISSEKLLLLKLVLLMYFNNNYGSFSLRCNKIINHEHLTYIETFGIIQFTSVIGLLFS